MLEKKKRDPKKVIIIVVAVDIAIDSRCAMI